MGTRNLLIHAYEKTDPATLLGVVEDHLPQLVHTLESHLQQRT